MIVTKPNQPTNQNAKTTTITTIKQKSKHQHPSISSISVVLCMTLFREKLLHIKLQWGYYSGGPWFKVTSVSIEKEHLDKDRHMGYSSISQGIPEIASKLPEAGSKVWHTLALLARQGNQLCQVCGLRLAASRAGRQSFLLGQPPCLWHYLSA